MTQTTTNNVQKATLDTLQAHVQQKRFSAALQCSQTLLDTEGKLPPEAWALRGKALEGMHHAEAALTAYLQGIEHYPDHARLRLYAGHALTRAGQATQATEQFHAALRISPSLLDAYRGLLNFEAIAPDSRDCARILAVALNDGRSAMDRARACFLLGQISVDARRDDIGFTYYRRANHIVARSFSSHQRQFVVPATTLAIRRRHFQTRFEQHASGDDCPAIIVAGLPRSGKSLVESLLARDRGLLAGGELAFVRRFVSELDTSRDIDELAAELSRVARHNPAESPLARRYREFARRAQPDTPARRVIDTSPANLRRIGYLSLLHPAVPIIFCRREPLDLAVALYFKHFKTGHGYSYSPATIGHAIARSEQLMNHWLRELPNPMITVDYEALTRDPEAILNRLNHTLGLDIRSAPGDNSPGEREVAGASDWRLFTARSIDAHGSIRPDLIGFGKRFQRHMQGAMDAYREDYANTPRLEL